MLMCIITSIAPCNLTIRPVSACACVLSVSSVCVVFLHAYLLAWPLEPIIMKMLSVQVCSESIGHAAGIQRMHDPLQVECGKLVDLLFSSYSSTASNRAGNDVDTQESSSR